MKRWIIILSLLAIIFGTLANFALSETGLALREEYVALIPPPRPDVPENVRLHFNIAYGSHPRQKLDIYTQKKQTSNRMPAILLVHGGGWYGGDKTGIPTVTNSAYLTQNGWIVISINYRLLPDVTVVEQTQDVIRAVAYIQQNAHKWGINPHQINVMGHSSGGHIVALATARHEWVDDFGGWTWSTSVGLDASSYDIVDAMQDQQGKDFFGPVVGTDPSKWPDASPAHHLKKDMPPLLAICTLHSTCGHPYAMVEAAKKTGIVFEIQGETIDHGQISSEFGKENNYTKKIFSFIHKYKKPIP